MTLFVLERFAPRGMGGPRADLLYINALLSNATNFSNENEQRDSYRPAVLGGTCFYVSAETLSLESPLFSGIWREIRKKFIKNSQKNAKFELFAIELMKFINSIAKCFWRFLTKKLRLENGAKECIV